MSRSYWKGPFIEKSLLKKKIKKIWSRKSVIPSTLIGCYINVYNGKNFKKIFITREKVGFKFGDFCKTRQNNGSKS